MTLVRNYYHWRFGDIYYTKKGKGSPILLIHDMLPGGSGYEWGKIEDDLALEHTVYNLDLPGCGRSEKSGITYTNFVYVQAICNHFIYNMNSGSCCHNQCCCSQQTFAVFLHVLPPFFHHLNIYILR